MELLNKRIIRSKEDVLKIMQEWSAGRFGYYLQVEDFEKFPAVLIYDIDEHDYSMSYAGNVNYGIVYLDDFEDELEEYFDQQLKKLLRAKKPKNDPKKLIGKHVYAGGELNGISGTIVGTETDEDDPDEIYYQVKDDEDDCIKRYCYSELKFPKIKFVYE